MIAEKGGGLWKRMLTVGEMGTRARCWKEGTSGEGGRQRIGKDSWVEPCSQGAGGRRSGRGRAGCGRAEGVTVAHAG